MTAEENYKLNFEPNLIKIKSICNTWSNRSLSIKGKITLISFLMISLLQFPCTSISTPSKVFAVFKKISNDFIWNGKRNKIAYNVLIQDIEYGGLKLPDLFSRVQVIHLKWIRYMWKEENSLLGETLRVFFRYPDIKSLLTFSSNLSSQLDKRYQMLNDILNSWFLLKANNFLTESEIQEQSLWWNDKVIINKKSICWRTWLNAGIVRVNDLLHPVSPRFMSHEELALKYGINVSFLKVLQIRSCLPFDWRRHLLGCANPEISIIPQIQASDGSLVDILNITSKRIYSIIIAKKRQPVSAQRKWLIEFPPPANVPVSDFWESKYRCSFRSTRETKLQSFQFKLLHRILPCRKYLRTIRISEDFFFYCPRVREFWKMIRDWFASQVNIYLANTTVDEFMLGVPKEEPQARILNLTILTCKFYIFRQKLYHDSKLEFLGFLRELRYKLPIEKYICSLEGKASRFNIWNSVLSALG